MVGGRDSRRHARPRRVDLQVRVTTEELEVTVADDGGGLAAHAQECGAGRGLAGMRRRAAETAESVRWEPPSAGGTRVLIVVPHTRRRAGRMGMRLLGRVWRGLTAPGGSVP